LSKSENIFQDSPNIAMLREFNRLEQALGGMLAFREYMSESGHPDFTFAPAAHHKVMIKAFEGLEFGEYDRLIISTPPGAAKSTYAIQFKTWYAARHPDAQILAVSATMSLSETFGRRCRAAIQTNEWQRLTGESIHTDQQSVGNFGYSTTGSQTSLGVGSSVIGRRADLIVVDDYCTSFEEISSESRRQLVWEWFQAELKSRLRPGGKIVVLGTRWDSADLLGEILRSEECDSWHHVRLPMLADSPDDPMGREYNQPLWPAYYTDRMIEEAQASPIRWSCMYQCLPLTDDGSWLDSGHLPIVDEYPKGMSFFGAADIALTQGAGDYTVILVAGLDEDRRLHIVDMFRDRITPDKIVEKMIELHNRWQLLEMMIDNDNPSKTLQSLAHEMMRRTGTFLPISLVPLNGQSKEVRASSFRGLALQDGVRLKRAPWNTAMLQEVDTFPRTGSGIHDDIIDALGLLGKRAARMGSGTPPQKHTPTEPPRAGIVQDQYGQLSTSSTLDELWKDNAPINLGTPRRI
jgi:predicted phage terminase large subunit-like protein